MIDPNVITTARVGDLPSADFNLTDNIPHEIGTDLKRGTVQQLADFISNYIGSSSSLSFNPTTVTSGGTLPVTTTNEWILVGKGTFQNVGGGLNITTTEELNALTSNGTYWALSVEIPIDVTLAGITQNIRSGYTQTVPSEDAIFRALQLISNSIPSATIVTSIRYAGLGQDYELPTGAIAFQGFINEAVQFPEDINFLTDANTFTQSGTTVTFLKTITAGQRIRIQYYL